MMVIIIVSNVEHTVFNALIKLEHVQLAKIITLLAQPILKIVFKTIVVLTRLDLLVTNKFASKHLIALLA